MGCETRAYRELNENASAIDRRQIECLIAQQPQQQKRFDVGVQENQYPPSTPRRSTYPQYPSAPPQVPTAPPRTQPQKPSVAATNRTLSSSVKISDNPTGVLKGTANERVLPPGYTWDRSGNVVDKNNQVQHRVKAQLISVQIQNVHDDKSDVGPLKLQDTEGFYREAKGKVTRAVKGHVTPGQDVFHVNTLYDADHHAYPKSLDITLGSRAR